MSLNTTKVYKASAGSGKTYRLAMEYLKLVIKDPDCYHSILAVTFTNKATAEMKQRILDDLYKLSCGVDETLSKSLIDELRIQYPERQWNDEIIMRQSNTALSSILHDYSKFRIETIDSFFQSILHSMLSDLGISSVSHIDLDNNSAIRKAIDNMYLQLVDDSCLREWLVNYTKDKIDKSNHRAIDADIARFSECLFKESFTIATPENAVHNTEEGQPVFSVSSVDKYKLSLQELSDTIKNNLKEKSKQFFDICDQHNADAKTFFQSTKGLYNYFCRLRDGVIRSDMFNSFVSQSASNSTKVLSAAGKNSGINAMEICSLINETESYRNSVYPVLKTIDLINRNLNNIALLYTINQLIKNDNQMQGVFMLSDTTSLLNKIIDSSSTPFIYERLGTHISHIMIDEFQDTSDLQWQNFKPIIEECLSKNGSSLIVGDPKQSIYRFRNGDWTLIERLGANDSEIPSMSIPMEDNWRSNKKIVTFNNEIFDSLDNSICSIIPSDVSVSHQVKTLNDRLRDIYRSARQNSMKSSDKGYVRIEFLSDDSDSDEKTNFRLMAKRRLMDIVRDLKSKGIKENDIAILCNMNSEIEEIAEYFAKNKTSEDGSGLNIVSSEAFRLAASPAVNMIIEALKYINSQTDELWLVKLYLDYCTYIKGVDITNEIVCSQFVYGRGASRFEEDTEFVKIVDTLRSVSLMPLYEMIEEVHYCLKIDSMSHQDSFVSLFLDSVNEFIGRYGGNLPLFIKYWDDKLCSQKLPSGSKVDGIRAMTIHKSKGLEYKTVIIPFADWSVYDTKHPPMLWCDTSNMDGLNDISPVAVTYSKSMSDTLFDQEYWTETIQMWADNVNKLYVGFTRAKDNLIVICNNETKKGQSVSDLLLSVFNDSVQGVLHDGWDAESNVFEYGELLCEADDSRSVESGLLPVPEVRLIEYKTYRERVKIWQSSKAAKFVYNSDSEDDDNNQNEFVQSGKLYHYLLSKIKTLDDLSRSLDELEYEGLIESDSLRSSLSDFVVNKVSNSDAKKWFAPGLTVFNERSIVKRDKDGALVEKRPDRVIIDNKKVIVVDYKFGSPHPEHKEQVLSYMSLFRDMGYNEVSGFLWYVYRDNIVSVNA